MHAHPLNVFGVPGKDAAQRSSQCAITRMTPVELIMSGRDVMAIIEDVL